MLRVLACLTLCACSEPVRLVVVLPTLDVGGKTHALGDVLAGRTARFYETKGALFVTDGATVPAPSGLARLPLATQSVYVISPIAVVHADTAAMDRGVKKLTLNQKLEIMRGVRELVLIEGEAPKGFIHSEDVRTTKATADELVSAAKAAVFAGNLPRARTIVDAALAEDEAHATTTRLHAALLHADGDARGWEQWVKVKPADPPSDHIPSGTAVTEAGPAFTIADKIWLREKPSGAAKKLRSLPIGAAVNVLSLTDIFAEITTGSARAGVRVAVINEDDLSTAPAAWEERGEAPAFHGFIATKMLAKEKPDAAALKSFGLARIDAGAHEEAVVPLRRAFALNPDREVQEKLVDAALRAEQFLVALDARRAEVALHTSDAPFDLEIVRVRGCKGDRERARAHIEPAENVLRAPAWSEFNQRQERGVIELSALPKSFCVEDDQSERACMPELSVPTIDEYFGHVCGDEPPENGYKKSEQREFEKYAREIEKENEQESKRFGEYSEAYEAWRDKVDSQFKTSAVVVRVTANVDRPKSELGVYHFTRHVSLWCGDTSSASRQNLELTRMATPEMKAGETLELWIDDASLYRAWGAVMIDSLSGEKPVEAFLDALGTEISGGDWRALPQGYEGVAVEAGDGIGHCEIESGCCGC